MTAYRTVKKAQKTSKHMISTRMELYGFEINIKSIDKNVKHQTQTNDKQINTTKFGF